MRQSQVKRTKARAALSYQKVSLGHLVALLRAKENLLHPLLKPLKVLLLKVLLPRIKAQILRKLKMKLA